MMNLCMVAHFAYGAMTGGLTGHMGGVERQATLMSKWLAARGHRVSLLTWDEGQEDEATIDGVRVIKMCRRDEGIPGLRFFHPRWSSLIRAMRRADADLYYQNCGEYVTGQVALWCRRNSKRFVYSVASDPDCDPILPQMKTVRERTLYRYGLFHADRVIVQTAKQQKMLQDGFHIASDVLPMPCPGPADAEYRAPDPSNDGFRVLWAGRISRVKRFEWMLDLAEAMPDTTFDVAGGLDADESYSTHLLSRARGLRNVIMHGRIAPEGMPDLYRKASVLCLTSSYEGFPNTFLEAWSRGVPVVSTIDPDGVIQARKLGIVAQDIEGLIDALRTLRKSPDLWREVSWNARRFYAEHHAVDTVMQRFEGLFLTVLNSSPTCMRQA